jgi:hypothetical protein
LGSRFCRHSSTLIIMHIALGEIAEDGGNETGMMRKSNIMVKAGPREQQNMGHEKSWNTVASTLFNSAVELRYNRCLPHQDGEPKPWTEKPF